MEQARKARASLQAPTPTPLPHTGPAPPPRQVIINALILTPFILYAMNFASRGWDWVHGAILASIFAPTDAVSVTAMLKAGGWVGRAG